MGELKDLRAPALSSTNRAKSYWRGQKLKSKTPGVDAFACNEVRQLAACLAHQIMHIARRVLAKAKGTGWSLRERVLRASPQLVISGRRKRWCSPRPQHSSGRCSGPGQWRCTGPIHNGPLKQTVTENARVRPIPMRKRGSPASVICQKRTRGRDGPANHRLRPLSEPEKGHRGLRNRSESLSERGSMNIRFEITEQ